MSLTGSTCPSHTYHPKFKSIPLMFSFIHGTLNCTQCCCPWAETHRVCVTVARKGCAVSNLTPRGQKRRASVVFSLLTSMSAPST